MDVWNPRTELKRNCLPSSMRLASTTWLFSLVRRIGTASHQFYNYLFRRHAGAFDDSQ